MRFLRIILLTTFYILLSFAPALAQPAPAVQKAIDAAQNLNKEIQEKIDTSPVVKEVTDALPSEEQTKSFFRKVGQALLVVVRFIAKIFDWIIELISNLIYGILGKIGLGFLGN